MSKGVVWQTKRYISYLIKSNTRFKVHSPFVFELIQHVLRDQSHYPDYKIIESYKKELSRDDAVIETVDFGQSAGENSFVSTYEKLGPLVKRRSQRKMQGRLLYRLNRYLKPKNMLEFGTAAGISTAYLKLPAPQARMITMEGCDSLAKVATTTFQKLNVQNTEVRTGNFDTLLPKVLNEMKTLDMVFFDGNHRKEPTLEYFNQCVEKVNENSFFVFDDIHWSSGMEEAWEIIKKDPRITVSVDVFWFGIAFFRKGIIKQDFIIRY